MRIHAGHYFFPYARCRVHELRRWCRTGILRRDFRPSDRTAGATCATRRLSSVSLIHSDTCSARSTAVSSEPMEILSDYEPSARPEVREFSAPLPEGDARCDPFSAV